MRWRGGRRSSNIEDRCGQRAAPKLLGGGIGTTRSACGLGQAEGNAMSVRLELQADCLAGVWANRADKARNILESGDVDRCDTFNTNNL